MAMNNCQNNGSTWYETYIRAYKKMVNTGAIPGGFAITGDECPSGISARLQQVT